MRTDLVALAALPPSRSPRLPPMAQLRPRFHASPHTTTAPTLTNYHRITDLQLKGLPAVIAAV